MGKRKLDRLTLELGLDDTQKKAVAALIAKDTTMTPAAIQARKDAQKRIDTLLMEFTKDTFDAKKLDVTMGGKTPHDGVERTANFTAGLLTILLAPISVRRRGAHRAHGEPPGSQHGGRRHVDGPRRGRGALADGPALPALVAAAGRRGRNLRLGCAIQSTQKMQGKTVLVTGANQGIGKGRYGDRARGGKGAHVASSPRATPTRGGRRWPR